MRTLTITAIQVVLLAFSGAQAAAQTDAAATAPAAAPLEPSHASDLPSPPPESTDWSWDAGEAFAEGRPAGSGAVPSAHSPEAAEGARPEPSIARDMDPRTAGMLIGLAFVAVLMAVVFLS